MTKSTKSTKSETTTTPAKTPSHAVYHVRDRDGQKGFWTRIGAAWAHADGQGFNVQIECVPLDGRISLRVITETKE